MARSKPNNLMRNSGSEIDSLRTADSFCLIGMSVNAVGGLFNTT